MTTPALTRRNILGALTLGAAGLSAGTTFAPRRAHAAGAPPRRIVFIYLPNGIKEEARGWENTWVKPPATPGGDDFTLTGMTTPLEPLRKQLVFLDGMAILAPNKEDAHIDHIHMILTGGSRKALGKADRISIDQYLGQKIGRNVTPRFPSLELGVQTWGSKSGWAKAADGTTVPAVEDPYKLYDKLFATLPAEGAAPDAGAKTRLLLRKSVLDQVTKDLARFRAALPAEDRVRADAQLDAVRTMETRLSTGLGAPPVRCGKPAALGRINIKESKALRDVTRMQFDLLTAAFACDLSRISTVMFFDWRADPYTWGFDPVNVPTYLHDLSHGFRDAFILAKRVLFEEIVYFAKKLESIPEGDGSMLDNTTIVCTSEISTGHTGQRIPWVTIGGKNMGVRVGKYITLPRGTPHQKLLVSFLNAMGLPDETFGISDHGAGPMPGYLG